MTTETTTMLVGGWLSDIDEEPNAALHDFDGCEVADCQLCESYAFGFLAGHRSAIETPEPVETCRVCGHPLDECEARKRL